MQDPQVLELKKRVEIIADAELTKIHPAIRAGIVEISTTNGRHCNIRVDRVPGAPYNPLSVADVEEKFLSLSIPVIGEEKSTVVVKTARNLEGLSDASDLGKFLRI